MVATELNILIPECPRIVSDTLLLAHTVTKYWPQTGPDGRIRYILTGSIPVALFSQATEIRDYAPQGQHGQFPEDIRRMLLRIAHPPGDIDIIPLDTDGIPGIDTEAYLLFAQRAYSEGLVPSPYHLFDDVSDISGTDSASEVVTMRGNFIVSRADRLYACRLRTAFLDRKKSLRASREIPVLQALAVSLYGEDAVNSAVQTAFVEYHNWTIGKPVSLSPRELIVALFRDDHMDIKVKRLISNALNAMYESLDTTSS